jgi:hypothetical protein
VTQRLICDGCDRPLYRMGARGTAGPGERELIISGERVNQMRGAGVPSGRFDWCLECAQAAFTAVEARAQSTAGVPS